MKNLLNLGKVLSKKDQQSINGGGKSNCFDVINAMCRNQCCPQGYCCGGNYPYQCVEALPNSINCR